MNLQSIPERCPIVPVRLDSSVRSIGWHPAAPGFAQSVRMTPRAHRIPVDVSPPSPVLGKIFCPLGGSQAGCESWPLFQVTVRPPRARKRTGKQFPANRVPEVEHAAG
jgi:hypothetical protein